MKIEDLRGTKIYLSNVEDRIKFQKKVFNLGVEWCESGKSVANTEHMFYYIDSDLRLSYADFFYKLSFIEDNRKQIFLDEVLSIEGPKEECKFKPFDKVLVRDSDNVRWRPRLFAWHNVDYKEDYPYPFETTDGCFRKYCIPYKGNEELANTTKSKDE